MKTALQQSYSLMWATIEVKLLGEALDKYNEDLAELRLLIAIIIQAGKDLSKDPEIDYFKTDTYTYHCHLLRLNPVFVAGVIKKAINVEASGILWVETPPQDDDL